MTSHTYTRYDKELVNLRELVDRMGVHVSVQMGMLLKGIEELPSEGKFDEVIENDTVINGMEVKASKTVLKLLARRAPVGKDLRMIIAASRVVTDLERIGDESVTIARALIEGKSNSPCTDGGVTVSTASLLASGINLLERALLALQNDDVETAQEMMDKHVANEGTYYHDANQLIDCIKQHHESIEESFNAALQANSLKRICDHIHNICEHTVFLVEGEDIRHPEVDDRG
ncbi:MAG: phosphate signaling complex protein PhoU [Gammaproteobacteria bacterium]